MSLENHPNFHAVRFVTRIFEAYLGSLRGGVNKSSFPDITGAIEDFTHLVENIVDDFVSDITPLNENKE